MELKLVFRNFIEKYAALPGNLEIFSSILF